MASPTIDLVCLAFAAWTLLCHGVVFCGGNLHQLLWAAGLSGAAACVRICRKPPVVTVCDEEKGQAAVLWALCSLCALVVLVAHRPDHDDGIYLSLAAGIADFPDLPLLRYDPVYGMPGLPISLAVYKVHGIEALYGALSYLTGMQAITASHLVSAPFWGFMAPLALARLFRAVDARRWLWGVLGAVGYLLLDGSGHGGYGNLAFVRLFQGKAVFLTVFAPLVAAYALRFAEGPTPRRWLLLAAALVASVGASASSLWAGPLIALLALASVWRPGRERTAAAFMGAAAVLYPLALGLAFRAQVHAGVSEGVRLAPGMELELLKDTVRYVFGGGAHAWALFAAVLLGPFVVARGPAPRFAALSAVVFFIALFNPWVAERAALNLTGLTTYFRVFWVLPVPLLAGLLAAETATSRTWTRGAAALLLLGVLLPSRFALSRANGVELKAPGLKVPAEYPLVAVVNAGARGRLVIAPKEVSQWLVTQNRHAFPLLAKPAPYDAVSRRLGKEEVARRERVQACLGGDRPARLEPGEFAGALKDYQPAEVCFLSALPWGEEIRGALREAGFVPRAGLYGYETWDALMR